MELISQSGTSLRGVISVEGEPAGKCDETFSLPDHVAQHTGEE